MSGASVRLDVNTAVRQGIQQAVDRAVWEASEYLLGEANRTVPHATGALERSGDVVKARENTYDVVYRTPYAVKQHEDQSLSHPDPANAASRPEGRSKWLEQTAREQKTAIDQIIAGRIRGAS